MRGAYRPFWIAVGLFAAFVIGAVVVGAGGWGHPAGNEQAIGEVSRWCERVSGGFLREPVNTLGNLGFVVSGLAMFLVLGRDHAAHQPRQNRMIGIGTVSVLYAAATLFLGPGSMVMHGTHTFFGAWLDNVSMVAFVSIPWLLNVSEMARWRRPTLIAVYATVVTVYAAGYWLIGPDLGIGLELFRVSIPLWVISEFVYRFWSTAARLVSGVVGFVVAAAFGITPLEMIQSIGDYWWWPLFWLPGLLATYPPPTRRTYTPWFPLGAGAFLLAYAIWLTGKAGHDWCRPDSLIQGHAIWHLLGALATWSFFKFYRTGRKLASPHDAIHDFVRYEGAD